MYNKSDLINKNQNRPYICITNLDLINKNQNRHICITNQTL